MYKLSRYWNKLAYFILRTGQKMIWDYTKKNGGLLLNSEVARIYSEAIFCGRK